MHRLAAVLAGLVLVPAAAAASGDRGSTLEAQLLVKKAVTHLQKEGKAAALAAFSDPKGGFVAKDLYVFAYDLEGNCVAHGARKENVGKNFWNAKGADGKFFVREGVAVAKEKGKGWFDYQYTNPVSMKAEDKIAYVELVDGLVIGSGAYKQ